MEKPLYIVFLAGGIASGKSRVSRQLASLGAQVIDLDELSRHVLDSNEQLKHDIVQAFGVQVVDEKTGQIDRARLAQCAFESASATALLEDLELPAIKQELLLRLTQAQKRVLADTMKSNHGSKSLSKAARICVVEVPLLDRMEAYFDIADEVVLVDTPVELRCKRAMQRGMSEADFWARAQRQAPDQWLRAHADTILPNGAGEDDLARAVALWWKECLDVVS